MGILIATGTIELAQFWPKGESDADTTKVVVKNFRFTPGDREQDARPTSVFAHAVVRGRATVPAIDEHHRITVRYQGIDAPELHYQGQAEVQDDDPQLANKKDAFHEVNKRYRQNFGETSSVELAKHLSSLARGADTLPCRVITRVDHPNQVFDTYGRLVGNIIIGESHDLNLWLVDKGWAFPTFYASMSCVEIKALLKASAKAGGKGVWAGYSPRLSGFAWKQLYRKDASEHTADAGAVIMPKLFRRQVTFNTNHRAGIVSGGFVSYLRKRKTPDACFLTSELLDQGLSASTPHVVHEFVKGTRMELRPEELVFQEAPSTLVDTKGRKIGGWG